MSFVSLLWRNIYSELLPIFIWVVFVSLNFLFNIIEFFIFSGYNPLKVILYPTPWVI